MASRTYNPSDIPDVIMDILDKPVEELTHTELRFWVKTKYNDDTGCVEWDTPARRGGYPSFYYKNDIEAAHRVAYELVHGEIPEGGAILHRCDNRICLHPRHIRHGTKSENTREMYERNDECGLSPCEVREIKRLRDEEGLTYEELGDRFGLHCRTIGRIIRGETYAWVDDIE